ncbi:transposon-transfer assisting family protein [Lachnospiraceae bacterium NSJ-143]|nr:transposon-transfer assisting family protein [Lachnospiraceae bacterium NSJ-143]
MMNFTVEEMNLIDIYKADTRAGQLAQLRAVRPLYENDAELLAVVDSAARKLAAMTDADFLETAFVPAYPVLYDEGETEDFAYGK